MVKLDYKSGKPLHEQISCGICELIMCGALAPDEQLPSVRDLSVSLTVNPNTVQRAYKSLEADGLIYSIKGKGNFVSDRPSAEKETVEKLYDAILEAARALAFYGENKETALQVLRKAFEEGEADK